MDTLIRQTEPCWQANESARMRPALDRDATADVCIVGAGLAGLCVAYELARAGRSVVVLDDGPIAGGETGRTTAHLASAIDDRFHHIERLHGREYSRLCYESHGTAIDWIERAVADEAIDCGFARVDGYLFLPPGEKEEVLSRELTAAHRAGFTGVSAADRAPLRSFDTGRCLRFPRQGQFRPLAFVLGLAHAIEDLGGSIYCGSHVHAVDGRQGLRVSTERAAVRAADVVIATNSPVIDVVTMHTKQAAYRTYAVALPIEPGDVQPGLYWDTSQEAGDEHGPYHYVRLVDPEVPDTLLVGGEDHKTGQADDAEARWARLTEWSARRFRITGPARHRWSGQVMEPVDGIAFIGRNPTGPRGTYIVTGDSGMGMTHGAIAGMLIGDLICGRRNPWAEMYDPARRTFGAALDFARENLNTAAQYADWLRAGDPRGADQIKPGEAAVIRSGVKLLACYRDPAGVLHVRSARCTHLHGVVRWNSAERSWDCPCHGSRFGPTGGVLNGPAIRGLTPVHGPAKAGRPGRYAGEEERSDGEVRQEGVGARGARDAEAEARDAQERRVGEARHEPQAGDRDRAI